MASDCRGSVQYAPLPFPPLGIGGSLVGRCILGNRNLLPIINLIIIIFLYLIHIISVLAFFDKGESKCCPQQHIGLFPFAPKLTIANRHIAIQLDDLLPSVFFTFTTASIVLLILFSNTIQKGMQLGKIRLDGPPPLETRHVPVPNQGQRRHSIAIRFQHRLGVGLQQQFHHTVGSIVPDGIEQRRPALGAALRCRRPAHVGMVLEEQLDDVPRRLEAGGMMERRPLLLVQTQEGGGVGPEQGLHDVGVRAAAGAGVMQRRPPVGTGVPRRGRVGQGEGMDARPVGDAGGVVDDGRDGLGIVQQFGGRRGQRGHRDAGRAAAPQETSRLGVMADEAAAVRIGAGPPMTGGQSRCRCRSGGGRGRCRGHCRGRGGRRGHTDPAPAPDHGPGGTGAGPARSPPAGAAGVAAGPAVGRRRTAAGRKRRRRTEVETGEGHVVPSSAHPDADADADANSEAGRGRLAQPRRVQVVGGRRHPGAAGGGGGRDPPVGSGGRRRPVEHGRVGHAAAPFVLLAAGFALVTDAVGPRRPTTAAAAEPRTSTRIVGAHG
mmetsp:Transcript_31776/g.93280  ORF Transcript_31776/g.93280 Transcript_31776/m.93280 type:complete len:548 (+) Transcript_31776:744-2387(+)